MRRTPPFHSSTRLTVAAASIAALGLAAAATPGRAQESGATGLRGTTSGSGTTGTTATSGSNVGAGAQAASPASGSARRIAPGTASEDGSAIPLPPITARSVPAARGLRAPQTRRSRAPTSDLVRAQTRGTLTPTSVVAPVQVPQSGLPDIAPTAPPLRRRPLSPDDPYAPIGLRVGNINLYPVLGESVGYDSNPNRVDRATAHGSFVSQTELELGVQSDWSRHELTGFLRGAYNEYPGNPNASRPEGAGRLGLRLDITRDTVVDAEAHYQLDTQRQDSPDLNAAIRGRPIVNTEGGSVGVTQRFNRLAVTLRGTIDRTDYADATLLSGALLDQSDRAYNQYGARLRLAYEFSPGLVPFIEGTGNVRDYDRRTDNQGYRRSSTGAGARVGTTFEFTRLVTGEISAGAVERHYDDARLKNLTSPVVDGSLVWAATPITNVRLAAQTTIDETTVVGSNGVVSSRASLEVAHALRRNLTITPGLNIFENAYKGVPITEHGFGASLKLDYRLTRSIAVRASYTYEQLKSSLPGTDYTTNVFLVGMRLQP